MGVSTPTNIVVATRGKNGAGKRKPHHQEPTLEEDYDDEEEEEGLGAESMDVATLEEDEDQTEDDEEEEEHEGEESAVQVTEQRRSKRTVRRSTASKALHDDLDDDEEIDAAINVDKHRALALLKSKLKLLTTALNVTSRQSKALPSTDRKKIRNRQASCVSRLKKKIMQVEMEIRLESLEHEIAERDRMIKERDALLERHGLMHLITSRERRVERAGTPGSQPGEPTEHAVVPVQSTPKRPRGRPRKHPRPEDIAAAAAAAAASILAAPSAGALTPGQSMDVTAVPASLLPPMGLFTPELAPARTFSATPAATPTPLTPTGPAAGSLSSSLAALSSGRASALLRQVSVPNPVCLCHGEEEPNMISCTKCLRPYHRYCVGLTTASTAYLCNKCK